MADFTVGKRVKLAKLFPAFASQTALEGILNYFGISAITSLQDGFEASIECAGLKVGDTGTVVTVFVDGHVGVKFDNCAVAELDIPVLLLEAV